MIEDDQTVLDRMAAGETLHISNGGCSLFNICATGDPQTNVSLKVFARLLNDNLIEPVIGNNKAVMFRLTGKDNER